MSPDDYKIRIADHEIEFVDRKEEINTLKKWIERGSPTAEFIYGPEGCGKSTLLRYLAAISKDPYTIIYIDALEQEPAKALQGAKLPEQEVIEIASHIGGPAGAAIARAIMKLLERIHAKLRFEQKHLAILVDDPIRALGLDKCEAYIKWLYELIQKTSHEFKPKTVLILATSSEGTSRRLLLRHTYVHITLMWNLPYQGAAELAHQLPKPRIDPEELWLLTGGNPRAIIDLALRFRWNTRQWIKEIKYKLAETIKEIKHKKLETTLLETIDDPDTLWHETTSKTETLLSILEKHNLIIYKHHTTLTQQGIPPNPELGIGKYYAWQIPAYKIALQQLLQEH